MASILGVIFHRLDLDNVVTYQDGTRCGTPKDVPNCYVSLNDTRTRLQVWRTRYSSGSSPCLTLEESPRGIWRDTLFGASLSDPVEAFVQDVVHQVFVALRAREGAILVPLTSVEDERRAVAA